MAQPTFPYKRGRIEKQYRRKDQYKTKIWKGKHWIL